MLLHKHLEHLFATVAAEGVGPVGKGECGYSSSKGKTAEIAELCGRFHLLPNAEGLDIGDDAPAVQDIDGGGKRRLLAFRNAVADLFEESAF